MKNKTKQADYKLESVNVRVVENGYVVSCEKRITDEARQGKAEHFNDNYKSTEKIADDMGDAIKIVSDALRDSDADD